MKAAFAILALATSTLAHGLQERWYSSPPEETDTTIWTTYTSTTICPVTSTTTEKGTTKWVTSIATSTVVVTSCVGGCGGVVTVPGPTGWETTTTDVVVTYTTTCPVEETVTASGITYTQTYTATSVVETVVPTTIVNTITAAPHTTAVPIEVVETITSLCPVTETTTISGKEVTVTYTTTSFYTTRAPTYVEVTATAPGNTQIAISEVVSTITSLCPVTETKTVSGALVTVIYTTTSFIVTRVGATVEVSTTLPAQTTIVGTEVLQTITSLCPVTEIQTISGAVYTVTKTTTSLIVTNVGATVVVPTTLPAKTTTVGAEVFQTITSLCPVTEIQTISGVVYTVTNTLTSLIVTNGQYTEYSQVTLPPQTQTIETYVYQTSASLCAVTEVQTVSGIPITKVFTSTIYTQVRVPTTIVQYITHQATQYETTDVYQTTTCIESVYTTVSAGSTIVLTATKTNTIQVTAVHVITSTLPAATGEITVYAPTIISNTISSLALLTLPSIVQTVTIPITHYANTTHAQTSTILQPSTLTIGVQTTSAHVVPTSPSSVASTAVVPSAPVEGAANRNAIANANWNWNWRGDAGVQGWVVVVVGVVGCVGAEVFQTITSLCPVTEIQTISGVVYTVTNTLTSLIVTNGQYTEYSQVTLPPQTQTIETYVYQTSASLCAVTEVQTVSGIPITKVFTSTIYTQVRVPTTIVQYITHQATQYETTDVYQTTTCIESVYTTVSAGSTIVLTATKTNTIQVTAVHVITSTLPAATGEITVYAPTIISNTISSLALLTLPSIVQTVTIPITHYANTTHAQTSTILQPSTLTIGVQTTSAHVVPTSPSSVASTAVVPSAPVEGAANRNAIANANWELELEG
ncbi:hypothetical protein NHQ30_005208 [Ciborinia camelliae]|nr:hypothetical protein NHQ30_005208 [Ciborinia camelliae]